jgi:hypothetical protein
MSILANKLKIYHNSCTYMRLEVTFAKKNYIE